MQRKILQGVPYWVDSANKVYIWQSQEKPTNPQQIGTYDPKTEVVTLLEGWKQTYAPIVQSYRESQSSRPRKVGDK